MLDILLKSLGGPDEIQKLLAPALEPLNHLAHGMATLLERTQRIEQEQAAINQRLDSLVRRSELSHADIDGTLRQLQIDIANLTTTQLERTK